QAGVAVEVGGVRTNFRMPDVFSIGMGGGSLVSGGTGDVQVGPQSVGFRLTEEALIFGGGTLTASDIAVAAGMGDFGDASKVSGQPAELVDAAVARMQDMLSVVVERMRLSPEPIPVIAVGGGSILAKEQIGNLPVRCPENHAVANAVGAAIAQISGELDRVYALTDQTRDKVLEEAKAEAIEKAVEAGAKRDTVEIVDVEDVPLAYLPGNATRVRVKAVGDLDGIS
ncbi:MAG: hydantoinase/oxoprolinase family protein, partial [Verrucomicrobiota bacterium]|nr:hydantoinase/oxoprolinase family protein [Verrucomicrobiota bacterium]